MHLVLSIAYDGSSYFGWQKTQTGPSVEQSISDVLSKIFQQNVLLRAASRTDKGVHAHRQIVDCFLPNKKITLQELHKSLNQLLPPDIRCLHLNAAP